MKKLLYVVCITVVMCLLLVLCMRTDRPDSPKANTEIPLSFVVPTEEQDLRIECWDNGSQYYVFLPSFAKPEDLTIALSGKAAVSLDGLDLTDGMRFSGLELNRNYSLSLNGESGKSLRLIRSAHVAAMFVRTETGNMDLIHADKTWKERAELALFSPDGTLLYQTPLTDKIRGHGNSTWELGKKSYNLYLGQPDDLFGMGRAEKYVLISNAIDDTNLRNRIVYDFARAVGGRGGFAPECEFVDLYLNGNYAGLYLLCEKPEIASSRLDISPDSLLFEITCYGSADEPQVVRLTGETFVEIHTPDPVSGEDGARLEAQLQELQEALLSDRDVCAATGRSWQEMIDLDSWARKYLIEEIFENSDANFFSQYFYQEPGSGLFYAGPCWDYDGAIGMFDYFPNCFLARRSQLNATLCNPLFSALWEKESFADYVKALYQAEYLPELRHLMNERIPELAATLEAASEMNRIRWFAGAEDSQNGGVSESVAEMTGYLQKHVAFLNSAWIDDVRYCTLTLRRSPGDVFLYYCVPVGEECIDLPTPASLGATGEVWYCPELASQFDCHEPVTEDLTLTAWIPQPSDG